MTVTSGFVDQTEVFVKEQIALLQHDASHDWSHIDRVRKLAIKIAAAEKAVSLLQAYNRTWLHHPDTQMLPSRI